MRYIAVFLLLANLGYLGWNLLYPPEPRESVLTQPVRPLLNTGIVTLTEFRNDAELQAELNARAEQLCSLVAGFQTIEEAEVFLSDARSRGYTGALDLQGEMLPSHFQLYLPPASSRAIATIALDGLGERLAEANLSIESYLITRGALENAVALGIYEDEESARAVSGQLEGLGFEPVMAEIRRTSGEIGVWLRPSSETRINESEWLDLSTERPNLTRSENLCETLVQAPQFQ
jgi:hypothetical protein